jgi:hypothetical protein
LIRVVVDPGDGQRTAARVELAKGTGVPKTARLVGLGTGTVQMLKAGI